MAFSYKILSSSDSATYTNYCTVSYSDKIQASQMMLTLLEGEAVQDFLEEHWQRVHSKKADSADIELIHKLAQNNVLPIKVRDEMCELLLQMVPQFENLSNGA